MNSGIVTHLWLIPAAPLLASLLVLFLFSHARKLAAATAVLGQVAALLVSIAAFVATLDKPGFRAFHNFTWFTFGNQAVRLGWLLDPLTAVMLLMISFVGLCIFVFSIAYMADDKNFSRFFAYLSFFSAAMFGVVIANSLLLLFICWELVGLASFLLIGFWIERPSAAAAAKKAFITTRIGDMGLFLGMVWLYHCAGSLLFYDRGHGCLEAMALGWLGTSATAIALLIFSGAVGKSGQFPLHVWLPDAMEGPTPVSALIHAATMVAAGVFLVARAHPVFSVGAVNGVTTSLTVVVWIGVITGLMAALIASAQFDIKRILAYSTVSQLGLMMVSLGVGGVAAGIMHLLAHGFFKALLFLGAGSVIHGLHHEQDIRKMGALRRAMPITFVTYAVGMMALSGIPLFFCGAWTKEEILFATSRWPVSHVPYVVVSVGVILTAFYMTRQMIYVFFGHLQQPWRAELRDAGTINGLAELAPPVTGQARKTLGHESPRVMTIPLAVLAICTVLFSFVLTPAWPWLDRFLVGEPAVVELAKVFQPLILLSLLLVGIGISAGILLYRNATAEVDPLEKAQPGLFRFLANRMWLDELYQESFILWSRTASRLGAWLDRYIWDGFVRAFSLLAQFFGIVSKGLDERAINSGVDESTTGARGLGVVISRAHSGQIQTYLAVVGVGMLGLLLLYAWLG
jgi:NADH-quinone oxidoreductase subunit L